MIDFINDFDPVRQSILTVLSLVQVTVIWMTFDKPVFAWRLGVLAVVPWVAYILYFGELGLVPFMLGSQAAYVFNLYRTRRKRLLAAAPSASSAPRSRHA